MSPVAPPIEVKGIAISIITEKEISSLIKIEEMTDIVIQPKQLFKGKLVDYKE